MRKQLEWNEAENKALADAGGNLGRVFEEWQAARQRLVTSILDDRGDSSHKIPRGDRDQAETSLVGKQASNLGKRKKRPVRVAAPPATEVRCRRVRLEEALP